MGDRKVATLFLWLAAIFAPLLILLTPPMQVADEVNHFLRAYQVSHGQLIGLRQGPLAGGMFPVGLPEALQRVAARAAFKSYVQIGAADVRADFAARVRLDAPEQEFAGLGQYSAYSPVPYLAQAVGVRVAALCTDRAMILVYGMRVANAALAIALIYLALRCTPFGALPLCALALSPMAFFQMCSASADGLTHASAILFVALIARAAPRPRLEVNDWWGLFATLFVLTQCKLPYLALGLLLWFVPTSAFGSVRRRIFGSVVLVGGCFAGYLAWFALIHNLAVTASPFAGVDPARQAHFILTHPLRYLAIFWHEQTGSCAEILPQFLGQLGWLDTPLPTDFRYADGAFLLAIFLTEPVPAAFARLPSRTAGWLIAGLCWLGLCSLIYMGWNPVGSDRIQGLQGRYLIPIAAALIFGLNTRWSERLLVFQSLRRRLMGSVAALALTVTCLAIWHRYYRL